MKGARLQSAMEYLMTYGWAILIIAVVLGVLYQLGIFNPLNLSPKAAAGSCTIFKNVNQYGTQLSLQGTCSGIIPQYVASFSDAAGSYASILDNRLLSPQAVSNGGAMTLCLWYDVFNLTGYGGVVMKAKEAPSNGNTWEYFIDGPTWQGYSITVSSAWNYTISGYSTGSPPKPNTWYFTCFTYNDSARSSHYYLNSKQFNGGYWSPGKDTYGGPADGTGNFIIGAGAGGYSNVRMANVQMYNSDLSANEIRYLYLEGIGGALTQLQNLVGWWPLNGNLKDYSGNRLDGSSSFVGFTYQWSSSYTPP